MNECMHGEENTPCDLQAQSEQAKWKQEIVKSSKTLDVITKYLLSAHSHQAIWGKPAI